MTHTSAHRVGLSALLQYLERRRENFHCSASQLDDSITEMIPLLPIALGGVLAAPFMGTLYRRATESLHIAQIAYEHRITGGLQPTTPLINLFVVENQEQLLVWMNLGYLVLTCGLYAHMRRREKAHQLKQVLTVYNLINVVVSSYVSASILKYKLFPSLLNAPLPQHAHSHSPPFIATSFICNQLPLGDPGLASVFAVYYLQKYFEFLDTYFFILRRSFRQVTFLHLFHHTSITVIVGSLMPFDFGGDMYFPILVNSLCHVAVYLHYFCTCLGLNPWWSPHLATLQVAQFAAIFLQSLLAFYEGPRCGSPDFSKILMMVYTGSMLVLFSDFFFKRYILRQPAYDMCGVMKNDPAEAGLSTLSYVGSVRLGPDGSAVVCLPRHFREGLSSPLYVYHLTPVGSPMPNLYVSREVLWGSGISDGEINCKRGDRTSSEGVVLMEQVVQRAGGSYSFVVRGGRPKGLVSWTVCCVVGDEAIRQH